MRNKQIKYNVIRFKFSNCNIFGACPLILQPKGTINPQIKSPGSAPELKYYEM